MRWHRYLRLLSVHANGSRLVVGKCTTCKGYTTWTLPPERCAVCGLRVLVPGEGGRCECSHHESDCQRYLGAVASAAKRWGVTKEVAEERMTRRAIEADIRNGKLEGSIEDYL